MIVSSIQINLENSRPQGLFEAACDSSHIAISVFDYKSNIIMKIIKFVRKYTRKLVKYLHIPC